MLATTLHGLQGTPYVYQGEEIGMANPKWLDISEFNDIESTNMFKILQERGLSADEALAIIRERSRDNSRTPMQWDGTANAGFTSGTPWLKVDESYKEINVKAQLGDPTSILAHYRKLIRLRKQEEVLTNGRYVRLDEAHPQIYAYARINETEILVVVSNFSGEHVVFTAAEVFWETVKGKEAELLIGNTPQTPAWGQTVELSPYASYMWIIR